MNSSKLWRVYSTTSHPRWNLVQNRPLLLSWAFSSACQCKTTARLSTPRHPRRSPPLSSSPSRRFLLEPHTGCWGRFLRGSLSNRWNWLVFLRQVSCSSTDNPCLWARSICCPTFVFDVFLRWAFLESLALLVWGRPSLAASVVIWCSTERAK